VTKQEVENLLITRGGRTKALHEFFDRKVEEWLQDGPEEVVRVLTLWATREAGERTYPMLNMGSNKILLELIEDSGMIQKEDHEP